MNNTILAKRYAQAFIGASNAQNNVADLESILQTIDTIYDNDSVLPLLLSPSNSPKEKQLILASIITKITQSELVINFFSLLNDKQRLSLLPLLKREFDQLLADKKSRYSVSVYTSTELSDSSKKRIQQTLETKTGKSLDIIYELDPSVIGGFKAVFGHTIYDGTLESVLSNLKQKMLSKG